MNEYERHLGAAGDPSGTGDLPGNRERSPEEIQREIEGTRERMSQNIDQLGERLSPQNLKRQAREAISGKAHRVVNNVGEQARETGGRVADFIWENPLPVAAVTLGAIWFIRQRGRSEISGDRMARFAYTGPERRREGVRGRIADRADHLRESVSGAASGVAERAGELVGDVGRRASDLGRGARERAGELGSRARQQTQDNPLAIAAGAAVLGLALGLLVPGTERERRLTGSTRDALVDRAQTTARRVKDATVEAGREVREAVREEVESRAPEIKSSLKDAAQAVTSEVKDAAGRIAEQAKQAAKERPR